MCLSYYSLEINPGICFHGEMRKKDDVDTPSYLGLYMYPSIMPNTCLIHSHGFTHLCCCFFSVWHFAKQCHGFVLQSFYMHY